jgi:hypothetical protein
MAGGRAGRSRHYDAAFYSGKNEAAAKAKGVKRVRSKPLHQECRTQTRAKEALVPQRSEMAHRMRGRSQT